jgi:hypothetical protein
MISVICVYNDKKILDEWLSKSLKRQTAPHEFMAIDNTKGAFKSAASALNHGAGQAKGKYLMFCHQDIDLSSDNWLSETEKTLDALPNLGAAGVAGRVTEKFGAITNIKHGTPPKSAGDFQITEPAKVQTVDECLFIVPRPVFENLKFDESACDDWHLYATDYCLSAQKLGFDAFVIPASLHHGSKGASFSGRYYAALKKLLRKHGSDYKLICAPYGRWRPGLPLIFQRAALFARLGLRWISKRMSNKT